MKISFEKRIFLGFVINLLVVFVSGWIFVSRLNNEKNKEMNSRLDWIELSLFVLSFVLLIIVYFIIRAQLNAKNISQNLLLENKQLLQSIIDNTTSPIFIKKINGEYILINKQFESLFKISNEEIIGKTDYDFLPATVADAYRNSDFEAVKALKELKTEETIQQQDGLHTYIAVKFPLFDSKGRVYALGGIFTDISDRKQLDESFKAADKFFNMSLDMMIIASKDKFIKINTAVSKILGYSEEELLSQPFLAYVYPDDIESTKNEVVKLQAGAPSIKFENRYICKDGSIKWILWSVYPDVASGLLYAVARDITALKESEKSLMEAENFFKMSYELLVVAKGDYFIKVNPAFTRTLGFDQNDMNKKTFLSFTHPDDLKSSIAAVERLKKGEPMLNFRARAICKDGSYKWLEWSGTIDMQTGIMYAVARDVTEKIQNEETLKIANMFFNMAFDILTVAKGEHFIKINQAFTKTLGYNQEDMDRLKFMDLIHPDDRKYADEVLTKHLTGSPVVNFRTRFICKDGSYKWLDWNSNMDVQQGVFYSVARDVTELVKLEEEEKTAIDDLYENEEKLRLIVENIGEGVIVANADKKIVLANDMANEIFGIEEDEKISSHLTDHFELYFPDEKTIFPSQNLPMERALNGEITDDVEVVLWNPVAQEKKRVLISGRPLVDQNNKVVAAVVTIKDISKYKQLEQELKETELKYRQLIGFRKGGDTAV
ncbi:PAS domain S-box-containing protein [Flavobacterium sp. CG_23.5]|uniref:PAS domain S-box protein n=1 Tax=unclassified Flavobacterium TaxID=196869 RepID=UPI0018C9C25C|nr:MULTISPECIES: PAS domain S-box protein [unclassified Flavobacterium]MBG6109196.1 PAS domain S-box-containing protein [Flavobacterium sp. CG_9.10]MBP2283541.1 PAS domain S-box-containing protein [Flavobacterium sp. CG_23.5]